MAGLRVLRVSAGFSAAADATTEPVAAGTDWGLDASLTALLDNLTTWLGSLSGRKQQVSIHINQVLDLFSPFSACFIFLRASLDPPFPCQGYYALNLLNHTQPRTVLPSLTGDLPWLVCFGCGNGKQSRMENPLPFLGFPRWYGTDPFSLVPNDSRSGPYLADLANKQKLSLCAVSDFLPPTAPTRDGIRRPIWQTATGGSDSQTAVSGEKKSIPDLQVPEQERIQILIRSLSGKTICKQFWTESLIKNIKKEIQADSGIPSNLLSLIYAGKILQDNLTVQHYGIGRDSTITVSTRLRGGSSGPGPKGTNSFKDAVKGKGAVKNKPSPTPDLPGPYIVEQRPQIPVLQVDLPEVNNFNSDLSSTAVICRFNGFWPKADALRQWIFSTWTPNCDIHLCSKGFFIVKFDSVKEKDFALLEGPWFWGNAGLFMTPWFPGFDPSTMVVSKMPVWVRLHNLPLHFWFPNVFAAIGNAIGSFIKQDGERIERGIHTFARICVEADLSQGLPDNIILIHNNSQWKQPLDYENTAFRCRGCQQTGHLHNTCPQNKRENRRNKKQFQKPRGWQCTVNPEEDTEDEGEPDTPPEQHEDPIGENIADDHMANNQEHPTSDSGKLNTSANKNTKIHQNQGETTSMDPSMGGIKRHHHSDTSDSDKETGLQNTGNQLVIALTEPAQGEWRKVEKKKGRKT